MVSNVELYQYLGYSDEPDDPMERMFPNEDYLVCMVCNITKHSQSGTNEKTENQFKIDGWILGVGEYEDSAPHGPFKAMEQAFDAARELAGVKQLVTAPEMF